MSKLADAQQWLVDNLEPLLHEHEVPAASVAVLADNGVVAHAAGVLNLDTQVSATVESIFQIGSITKLWTATLVMQLVDEGKVDLDAPICTYLPHFRIGDSHARDRITTRHLLSHCAGFEGDIFDETTNDHDAVSRLVDEILPDVPQLFDPGERYSYSNAGYVVLGYLVEVMREMPWDEALRRYLVGPLEAGRVAVGPDEAMLQRAAVGHVRGHKSEPLRVADRWAMPRSNGPAGARLAMPAQQLLKFARMHLAHGASESGQRLLSPRTVEGMQRQQVPVPKRQTWSTGYGLGWALYDYNGSHVIGHDGHTIGQSASLRVVPGHNVAVALLMNGGKTNQLYQAVFEPILRCLADVDLPRPYAQPLRELPIEDAHRYVGRYENRVMWVDVATREDGLWAESAARGEIATADGAGAAQHQKLVRVDTDTFAALDEDGSVDSTCVFVGEDQRGRAKFLHNNRAIARVDVT